MFDITGISVLIVLLFSFVWLARSSWRVKRPVIKWLGAGLNCLLSLVVVLLLGAALFGDWKLNRVHDNPLPQLSIESSPEQIARGERLAPYCAACHAPETDAALTGSDFLGEDAPPIGLFWSPNLTPTHLSDWSDAEIVRAIREGVHRSGRSLLIMPSDALRHLSDEDVYSIVAYLRSLPPEGEQRPANNLNTLGAILMSFVPLFRAQAPITEAVIAPPAGPTAAYGEYLTSFTCSGCHGADLLGGQTDVVVPPLVAIALAWSEPEFIVFIRSGVRPDQSSVDEEAMPWPMISRLFPEDEELSAIYAHLENRSASLQAR